jgi:outer membrane protein OmpA-like peptidoglycan-associated protein
LPKILQTQTARKNAVLTLALASALAATPWLSASVAQAPPPGTPPKCGHPGEPPCPKQAPQQQQTPKAPTQQPQPTLPKQQAQPQPPTPTPPQLKQQAQPVTPQPTAPASPNPPTQPTTAAPLIKQLPKQTTPQTPVVGQPVQPQPGLQQGQGTPPAGQQQHQTGQGLPGIQQGQGQPTGQQQQQQRQQTGTGQPGQGLPAVQQGLGQPPTGQQQRQQTGTGQPGQGLPGVQQGLGQPPTGQQQRQQTGTGQPVQGSPNLQQGLGQQGQRPVMTFQRVNPVPGQPTPPGQPAPTGQPTRPGQAPVTQVFVNVQDLRGQRHERTEAGGRVVIEEPDHRMIVREGGQAFVRHDENARLFLFGQGRVEHRGREVYSVIERPDGDQIVTVTDDDGRLIRRFRRERDGREIVLIDNHMSIGLGPVVLDIPAPIVNIPREQYVVDMAVAPEPIIYQTLIAPPLVPIERPYSLDEIRYNVALRDRMRRIDVDTINFDFGSWEVGPDEVGRLQLIAQAIQEIVGRNPNEVFLVEGHTDAVGQDVDNLSLSDRRAETVANILTESYQIPPENLTTQGYGAHFLKIQTPEPERRNRRVTVRRITPLLRGGNG